MKLLPLALLFLGAAMVQAAPVPLSDGQTFKGWEGDTTKTWRIVEGAFVGGSLTEKVPRNEFLATEKSYGNFDLRLKFKLLGSEGMINGGVQFRSVRIPDNFEMIGYQADMGDKYWGSLYDESRRKKVLVAPPKEVVDQAIKLNDWNDYRIRCEGPHIQLWVNGVQTVDYTETEANIAEEGKIAVQIHGGGKAEAWYKDIVIEELPAKQADARDYPALLKRFEELQADITQKQQAMAVARLLAEQVGPNVLKEIGTSVITNGNGGLQQLLKKYGITISRPGENGAAAPVNSSASGTGTPAVQLSPPDTEAPFRLVGAWKEIAPLMPEADRSATLAAVVKRLEALLPSLEAGAKMSARISTQYEGIFSDLLKLAETDADAAAIVERWKIQRTASAGKGNEPTALLSR